MSGFSLGRNTAYSWQVFCGFIQRLTTNRRPGQLSRYSDSLLDGRSGDLNPADTSGLRRGSATDRLLGFRVWIPPEAWMFVLCVLHSQDSQDKEVAQRTKNPDEGEIFRTFPDRPWGPLSLLCNEYRVPFPGAKRPRRGFDHTHNLTPW